MWQPIINEALGKLDAFLKAADWVGRENEVVNLFAHHFLSEMINSNGPLTTLSQIGIEVAVPQITGSKKKMVRKDLVIWPAPLMTAWSSRAVPAVIIEWKRNDWEATRGDIEWLTAFTLLYKTSIGFSVCAMLKEHRGIYYTGIQNGRITEQNAPADRRSARR